MDRLNMSVQQVLAGARELQLEDVDMTFSSVVPVKTRYRLNSDLQESSEFDEMHPKSPVSDYEVVEDESLEIIDYLANLLEKAQMETEDIRSQCFRLLQTQHQAILSHEHSLLSSLSTSIGLPAMPRPTLPTLAADITKLLRPEIRCTMEQLCACESALFQLLQHPEKDAEVKMTLGARVFALSVERSDADILMVGKKRLGANVGESLLLDGTTASTDTSMADWLLTDTPTAAVDHRNCELQIEELHHRIAYMKENIIPKEVYLQVASERQQLRRTDHIRRQEIDQLHSTRLALESLRGQLKAQLDEARIISSLLSTEQSEVSELKARLTAERAVLSELRKEAESERREMEAEKENFLNLANVQGMEVMTLKEKIEKMVHYAPHRPEETKSIPESLPDGDLRELDLRLKQMITLVDSETGDIDHIQQEITDIESDLKLMNQKRGGVRRVHVLLSSAKNKLVGLKSKQAIAGADRMMSNINLTIKALEKTWNRSESSSSPVPSPEIRPLVEHFTSPRQSTTPPLAVRSQPALFSTPTKTYSFPSRLTPITEEKDQCGRWVVLTETIANQESLISKLKQQLGHAVHKLRHVESREVRLGEKEAVLRALEKQLEMVNTSAERRMKAITEKEKGIREREMALLEAFDSGDRDASAQSICSQQESRLQSEEQRLLTERKDIEHEKMQLILLREETSAREKQFSRVKKLLARENLRVEKEKQKLGAMREELSHLLPSLQSLAKPKSF